MAPPAPQSQGFSECNQPARSAAHRKQSAHRATQRSVSQPARSASVRAQRSTSQTIRAPCSAAQRANATSPRAAQRSAAHRKQSAHRAALRSARMQPDRAHCIANNPRTVQRTARTDNQPAAHHHRTPRTCISAHALRSMCVSLFSTLRWFRLVRGTNFSKIQSIHVSNWRSVMVA